MGYAFTRRARSNTGRSQCTVVHSSFPYKIAFTNILPSDVKNAFKYTALIPKYQYKDSHSTQDETLSNALCIFN